MQEYIRTGTYIYKCVGEKMCMHMSCESSGYLNDTQLAIALGMPYGTCRGSITPSTSAPLIGKQTFSGVHHPRRRTSIQRLQINHQNHCDAAGDDKDLSSTVVSQGNQLPLESTGRAEYRICGCYL